MFYLCNVFQFIIDRFNQDSFREKSCSLYLKRISYVLGCTSLRKSFLNRTWQYAFYLYRVFLISYRDLPSFSASYSFTFPVINLKLRISFLSLIIGCNLNSKNHPIKYFLRSASLSNVLWIRILWLQYTRKRLESIKLISK
mgnify:CR=1 FL=1